MRVAEPLTITVEEAAKLLGVSRGLAYEGARTGAIPAVRIGRRLLVPRARLLELVGASANDFSNGPEEVVSEMSERRATGGASQARNAGDPVP